MSEKTYSGFRLYPENTKILDTSLRIKVVRTSPTPIRIRTEVANQLLKTDLQIQVENTIPRKTSGLRIKSAIRVSTGHAPRIFVENTKYDKASLRYRIYDPNNKTSVAGIRYRSVKYSGFGLRIYCLPPGKSNHPLRFHLEHLPKVQTFGLRLRSVVYSNESFRIVVNESKYLSCGIRFQIGETVEAPPYTETPNLSYFQNSVRIKLAKFDSKPIRILPQETKYLTVGLRIFVKERSEEPPYTETPEIDHKQYGLRLKLAKFDSKPIRALIQDTKILRTPLRVWIEETSTNNLQKHKYFGLRLRSVQIWSTPTRVNVENTLYTKGSYKFQVEDTVYQKVNNLRIIAKERRQFSNSIRIFVLNQQINKIGNRFWVEKTLKDSGLQLRTGVEKIDYFGHTARFNIQIQNNHNSPLKFSVKNVDTLTENFRIITEDNQIVNYGLRIKSFQSFKLVGQRLQIKDKQTNIVSSDRFYVEKSDFSGNMLRLNIPTSNTYNEPIRLNIHKTIQDKMENRFLIQTTQKKINNYRAYIDKTIANSFGIRIKVDRYAQSVGPIFSLRICVNPALYNSQDFRIVSKIDVRLGKYIGYFWVEYNDGLRDRQPLKLGLGKAVLSFIKVNNDGTEVVVDQSEFDYPDCNGKYYVDKLTQFEFNTKYIMSINIVYEGIGSYTPNFGRFEYLAYERAFYTTPPSTTLAYMIDPDEFGILLEF